MKKLILLVILVLLLLSGCKNKNVGRDSSLQESNISSQQSSKTNDLFPGISEPEVSSNFEVSEPEVSGKEDVFAIASLIDDNSISVSDLEKYENGEKGWGQGRRVNDKNRPVSCDSYQKKYGEYGGIFIMPDTKKTMYLTFDEGYENGYTSKILDSLKEKNVSAVFFVTMPYVKQNPKLIRRMIDEGHIIGNHSVNHKSMPTLDIKTAVNEISELHNYMVENYDYQMTMFRPPMGKWSTRTLMLAKALGYKTVFWSYAYCDWDVNKQMGVEKVFPKVSKAAHPGAVYLLHAVSKDNADMLCDLIDDWHSQGYTLSKLQ